MIEEVKNVKKILYKIKKNLFYFLWTLNKNKECKLIEEIIWLEEVVSNLLIFDSEYTLRDFIPCLIFIDHMMDIYSHRRTIMEKYIMRGFKKIIYDIFLFCPKEGIEHRLFM